MKIIFVRHGDPNYELDTLTPVGVEQAQALAEYLKDMPMDGIYSSPMGRAYLTATTCYPAEKVVVHDWMKEFYGNPVLEDGTVMEVSWDFMPSYTAKHPELYDNNAYLDTLAIKSAGVVDKYHHAIRQFDKLVAQYGYEYKDGYYKVNDSNTKTIIIFCHLGLMSVLMSRLMNASYVLLAQHMCASPSSITVFATEEREQGIAQFRCLGYGTTPHLARKNLPNSFSARFCEIYLSDDRH